MRNLNIHLFLGLALLMTILAVTGARAQQPGSGSRAGAAADPRMKQFDKDGDGKISDSERQAIREKMRQRGAQSGSMTPSKTVETVGDREISELEYASSDGRKIPCVLSMPKGDGPFPCVVTIHGGQGNRDLGYIRTLAAPNPISPTVNTLNEQPWAILAISYRAGDGALFGMEEDDVVAGIRFAKTLPKIDPARVGVLGGSHGGHLALRAAEVMGKEFLCVAVGSPWMTNPQVFLYGKADAPPLSEITPQARQILLDNRARLLRGLQQNRGMSAGDINKRITERSIEGNAAKIVIPALFLTSLADEEAPDIMVEPTIARMKSAGRDVTVFTVQKSPHGFYWGRDVGGARIGRGARTPDELAEEAATREQILCFFRKWFDGKQPMLRHETQNNVFQTTATIQPEKSRKEAGAVAMPPAAGAPTQISRGRFDQREAGAGMGRNPEESFKAMSGGSDKVSKAKMETAPDGRKKPTASQAQAIRKLREKMANAPVPENLQRRTLNVGGREREFFIHIPASAKGKPAPVVFALHGGASSTGLAEYYKVDYTQLADKEGFVVVYPSGVNGWNIGSHDAYSVQRQTSNADDIGFFRAMFDTLTKEGVADPKRIYVTGGSNGGVMTQFLVCHLADRIAGAGVVVATLPRAAEKDWPKPARPVPIMVMLGTADPMKPWNGNKDQMSAEETIAFWRKQNGCAGDGGKWDLPDRDPNDGCRVHAQRWEGKAPVVFYTLEGHGHGWPMQKGRDETGTGPKTRDISAPEEFWKFFQSAAQLSSARITEIQQ